MSDEDQVSDVGVQTTESRRLEVTADEKESNPITPAPQKTTSKQPSMALVRGIVWLFWCPRVLRLS